jgi:hypothetical protein
VAAKAGGAVTGEPLSTWTLKRLAWAYGCSKKGSREERRLLIALLIKVKGVWK